jgi:biopolymer transport protein ExbB/TolQ
LILLWHGITSVFYNNSSEGNKCSMAKWASVIGLALTAVGVVIAICLGLAITGARAKKLSERNARFEAVPSPVHS